MNTTTNNIFKLTNMIITLLYIAIAWILNIIVFIVLSPLIVVNRVYRIIFANNNTTDELRNKHYTPKQG